MTNKPVVLCILDGWGERDKANDNAIALANTPFMDQLSHEYPNSLLRTSGLAVGLPDGQMGNSEVGHMNIGSGRVVMQNLPRIDQALHDGTLANHHDINALIDTLAGTEKTCHILGLISDGGVHSHMNHVLGLADLLAKKNVKVAIHAFLDGRDTPPKSAQAFIKECEEKIASQPLISIASLSGRYYAMDRDTRWERVELAYNAIVEADGVKAADCNTAIASAYDDDKTDEFVMPTVIGNYQGVADGDALIMANFRADRAREILQAMLSDSFDGFNRSRHVHYSHSLGMVEYSSEHNHWLKTLFPAQKLQKVLGEVIANQGLKQLRIAETEKYAHVTFFFNGGIEKLFDGEERKLIPSPDVATYDLKPEMSAYEVTEHLVDVIKSNAFDVIIVNYANTDMVGHTGNQDAAIKAVQAVDECLKKVATALDDKNGVMLITADHGNAEQMFDEETGQPHTAHTMGPVPIILYGNEMKGRQLNDGRLCDIAPTILQIMDIPQPQEMTGEALVHGV